MKLDKHNTEVIRKEREQVGTIYRLCCPNVANNKKELDAGSLGGLVALPHPALGKKASRHGQLLQPNPGTSFFGNGVPIAGVSTFLLGVDFELCDH